MKKVKLGEVATFINGYAFKPQDWSSEGKEIIRIQNLTKTSTEINYYSGTIDKKYIVEAGDILISWSGTLGVFQWRGRSAVLNQHIFKVVFDKIDIDKSYFKYVVEKGLQDAVKHTHGSTMKHLTKKYFDNIIVPYTNLGEQQRIASELDLLSKLILRRQEQLEELNLLVKSKVTIIMQEMLPLLNNEQLLALRESLEHHLVDGKKQQKYSNNNLLQLFITAKQVEGCSSKTIRYYQRTIENLFNAIKESVTQLTTDDLRSYLANYQSEKDCSKANLDNIRRILSSFFAWLEQEEYIIKNPIRRIKKIKTEQNVKETYTDEHLEIMRDNCENLRDLAIIDLLASTGMRVGELVQLNRSDIDFENRECVVFGKGKKERPVYFDARTKIHLRNYLNDRKDSHPALFVTLVGKAQRLGIAGVEIRLRKLGDKLGIQKVHPHKFRRTLATKAIDKGMPIEQVQKLLGHSKIDTTLAYAMVNQNNVKHSHQKFIS